MPINPLAVKRSSCVRENRNPFGAGPGFVVSVLCISWPFFTTFYNPLRPFDNSS